jgi:hypothetical protein
MPAMLRSIIEDLLAREADLVVAGRTMAGEDPIVRAREEQADMLITSEPAATGDSCLDAILSGPPLSIMTIARGGREGRAFSLASRPIRFDQDDQSSFANAVRQAVGTRS